MPRIKRRVAGWEAWMLLLCPPPTTNHFFGLHLLLSTKFTLRNKSLKLGSFKPLSTGWRSWSWNWSWGGWPSSTVEDFQPTYRNPASGWHPLSFRNQAWRTSGESSFKSFHQLGGSLINLVSTLTFKSNFQSTIFPTRGRVDFNGDYDVKSPC